MNDAYNLSVSNSVNDLTDNTDAMMVFRNLNATTPEDIRQAKANGGFKVNDGGDVTWLVKNINDAYAENIKNRLDSDIHKLSFVPDMSDQTSCHLTPVTELRSRSSSSGFPLRSAAVHKALAFHRPSCFRRHLRLSAFFRTKDPSHD
jgi:hypothetical protein